MMVAVSPAGGEDLSFARWIFEPVVIGDAQIRCSRFLEAFSLGVTSFAADYGALLNVDATLVVAVSSALGFSPGTLRAIGISGCFADAKSKGAFPPLGPIPGGASRSPRLGFVAYHPAGPLSGMRVRSQLEVLARDNSLRVIPIAMRPGYPEHSVALVLHRIEVAIKGLGGQKR